MDKLPKIVKVLVVYHKESELVKSDILTPIHVGRDINPNNNWLNTNMIGDNTGENISFKNSTYCELTALYWAWKNLDADYIGLCHYRRFLSFKGKLTNTYELTNQVLEKIGLNDKTISRMCNKYDIILPPVYNTHPAGLPEQIMTNYDFYCNEHIKKDMDAMISVINTYYPEYSQDAEKYLKAKKSFFYNMFIMKRELYNDYMEFLFGVLGKLEGIIDISDDKYQARVFGFLAERLQNIFVEHLSRVRPELKVNYVQNVMFYAPSCKPVKFNKTLVKFGNQKYLTDKSSRGNQNINIVFSIDDNYVPHCSAALCSILLNSAVGNTFNIFILDGGLSNISKKNLEVLKKIRDFNISYVRIDDKYFKDLPLNRSYISVATYYRLLLPEVLPKSVDKVIYLDSDIIVEEDIANLWAYDLTDKYAAVVEDEGSIAQQVRLGLPAKNSYFNAGVCVFNIKELRTFDFQRAWKNYFKDNEKIITLQDQDILNGVFNGKCLYVPLKWNTNGRLYSSKNLIEHSYTYEEAVFAAHNPAIIHFTDVNKPWHTSCTHPLRKEYYKYLTLTPYKRLARKIKFKNSIRKIYFKEKNRTHIKMKILGIKFNINAKKVTGLK